MFYDGKGKFYKNLDLDENTQKLIGVYRMMKDYIDKDIDLSNLVQKFEKRKKRGRTHKT